VPSLATDWSFANAPYTADALRESPVEYGLGSWRAIGQMHNTYILAQSMTVWSSSDQHAAQEQIFFERLTTPASPLPIAILNQIN